MSKIKMYQLFEASTTLPKPIADATHILTELRFIVLRLHTDDNTIGESFMLSFQYSQGAIAGALHDVGDLHIGEEVYEMGQVFSRIHRANEYFGNEGINRWAQAAFNIAMWDAWCKILGQPVWKVLGGSRKKIPVYGSGGWLSYSTEELISEVSAYKSRGFRSVKIKVGR